MVHRSLAHRLVSGRFAAGQAAFKTFRPLCFSLWRELCYCWHLQGWTDDEDEDYSDEEASEEEEEVSAQHSQACAPFQFAAIHVHAVKPCRKQQSLWFLTIQASRHTTVKMLSNPLYMQQPFINLHQACSRNDTTAAQCCQLGYI